MGSRLKSCSGSRPIKLVTYQAGQRVGLVVNESIIDSGFDGSMLELITEWQAVLPRLGERARSGRGAPLGSLRLDAPIQRPGKVFAIGLNYADHIAETQMERPKEQVWFSKAQTAINGPHDPIVIAHGAPKVDYEAELVVVIGRRGKHIPVEHAAQYVFGYCVGNDVTERKWQLRTPQWCLGKSFDTHAPIGPWITTADEIADPHALGIRCWVNGTLRQNSNTRNLIFDIWHQIAHLSSAMTLEPGDLIFTGTPGGVGAAMSPPQFLMSGDVVRCEVEELGAIEATMIQEPPLDARQCTSDRNVQTP